ncbi:MAG: ferritin-like domain-containing protein [Candidatus Sericytochromatia bacterium]
MPTLAELASPLAQMADQAEAAAAAPWPRFSGTDQLPAHQRDAWRRVLRGAVSGEGIEEWVVDPMIRGLRAAGVADDEVIRFFRGQGADELRHRDLFAGYLKTYWGEPEKAEGTWVHKLLYDGLFQLIIKQSEQHPLRLLMPLLFYERAAGSLYMTRLIDCTPESAPELRALLKAVRQDEARHVAGVGMTCRALVAAKPLPAGERKRVGRICKLVYWDMDRTAWWKPGLAGYMRDLGLDAEAMRRDNDQILAEMLALIEGRG